MGHGGFTQNNDSASITPTEGLAICWGTKTMGLSSIQWCDPYQMHHIRTVMDYTGDLKHCSLN